MFVRLGRWQWDRAQSPTGGWQNLGYALQWPLFAVVLVAAWLRFLWLEQHGVTPARSMIEPDPEPDLAPPVPRYRTQPPDRSPNGESDTDDELATYNAYLARLAEQDRR